VVSIVLVLLKKNPTLTLELINLKLLKNLLSIKEKEEFFKYFNGDDSNPGGYK
jgi:hypothetical protein